MSANIGSAGGIGRYALTGVCPRISVAFAKSPATQFRTLLVVPRRDCVPKLPSNR
ncbi:hypothetical protein FIBSPDRAFT_147641 [Athelia psychrophila]|uniref:Uncharacterized protein n=1 Tax=Athelia psychrophila TaxID=1759441 RepID=A0A167ULM0_9AGAM|nr:hypothetical protein FIBSPDRAFT_428413 [Fibularhizoctonia sp. CBS 109695]KZP13035.1 hypothetical protein FIBSPDRAFT_147641 [Fibularhizoctonia sp. CBS 109695]